MGGYPEKHPEAIDASTDLINLKTKIDAGADFITTQLFFDNQVYFDFVKSCNDIGITTPVLPGLLPVLSLGQAQRFCSMCEASLPLLLEKELENRRIKQPLVGSKLGKWANPWSDWWRCSRISYLCPQ